MNLTTQATYELPFVAGDGLSQLSQ